MTSDLNLHHAINWPKHFLTWKSPISVALIFGSQLEFVFLDALQVVKADQTVEGSI